MKRKLVIVAVVLAIPVAAQLGIPGLGTIVWDPTNEMHLIASVAHEVTMIANQIQQIQTAVQHFNLATFQARFLAGRNGQWFTKLPPWAPTVATDRVALNSGYLAAINYGGNANAGYAPTVEPLRMPVLGNVPSDQVARLAQSYAAQERSDGAITHSMQVLGDARANEPAIRTALTNLQKTALSGTDTDNTEAAQLNAISAAGVISAQNSMTTNAAMLAMLEHVAHQNAMERNAAVQALNDDLYRRQHQQDYMGSQARQTSAALSRLRIP